MAYYVEVLFVENQRLGVRFLDEEYKPLSKVEELNLRKKLNLPLSLSLSLKHLMPLVGNGKLKGFVIEKKRMAEYEEEDPEIYGLLKEIGVKVYDRREHPIYKTRPKR
ncbi:hypothetical protein [Desulfurobacterium sp.]|uniref:hypothetical protein n=1 Tax=Desulfurobacterium sp. TaxID=2004706 RepID=UPI00261B0644|nr:hypothetical protein [Desulfurobacterium sp.]